MAMRERLGITGMGAVTPIGACVREYWQNLIDGKSGVHEITHFDDSALPARIAAEVRQFDGSPHMPRTVTRSAAPFMQFAFTAASEAISQARLAGNFAPERAGVCMGTALAGVTEITDKAEEYLNSASGKISPHFLPRAIGNMAAAHLAIAYGFTGPGFTLSTACSAGGDAIMAAAMLIKSGEADAIVVMGAESILCAPVVSSLAQAKALSRRNDDPKSASRPFDADRDGFVIGEGAGAIVLETFDHAQKRGAPIFADLAGWGNSMDAWHITAPEPDGKGAARCMELALARAGMRPCDIDYINAHGTSTQLGDHAEVLALKKVFGDRLPPVSSTKGATGHLMGAGGITEIIACIMAIQEGIIPPTLNFHNPDPGCDFDCVPNKARKCHVDTAMSNSLGFGGQNSSIIVTRHLAQGA